MEAAPNREHIRNMAEARAHVKRDGGCYIRPKVSARGMELEESAAARLNQFRGLPANGGLQDVNDGPLTQTPANATDEVRIAAAAERAVADGLHVESEVDHKPQSGRTITLVKSGSAA